MNIYYFIINIHQTTPPLRIPYQRDQPFRAGLALRNLFRPSCLLVNARPTFRLVSLDYVTAAREIALAQIAIH